MCFTTRTVINLTSVRTDYRSTRQGEIHGKKGELLLKCVIKERENSRLTTNVGDAQRIQSQKRVQRPACLITTSWRGDDVVVVPPRAGVLEEAEAVASGAVVLHCCVTSGFGRCELLLLLSEFSRSTTHFCGP